MQGIIKVSPQKLTATAGEFSKQGSQICQYTASMMELINQLNTAWEGAAATAYITRFRNLQDDITKLTKMVQEHSTDLQEMAKYYKDADDKSKEAAASLAVDVIR